MAEVEKRTHFVLTLSKEELEHLCQLLGGDAATITDDLHREICRVLR